MPNYGELEAFGLGHVLPVLEIMRIRTTDSIIFVWTVSQVKAKDIPEGISDVPAIRLQTLMSYN